MNQKLASQRWRMVVFLWVFLLVQCVLCMEENSNIPREVGNKGQQHDNNNNRRPIIRTFYERIPADIRLTGMSDQDDDALLEFWKASWYHAGWDPRVVSIYETAQLHPNYTFYANELNSVNLDEFNKLMFLRWLAMAASGGWMADYDVFPLRNFTTFGDGELTIYDKRLLPQLTSGSAEAYQEMAMALLQSAKRHKNSNKKQTYWTDPLALLDVSRRQDRVPIHKRDFLLMGQKALDRLPLQTLEDCDLSRFTKNRMAVHFGSQALLTGKHVKPHLRLPRHRLTVAKEWLEQYHSVCPWTRIEI